MLRLHFFMEGAKSFVQKVGKELEATSGDVSPVSRAQKAFAAFGQCQEAAIRTGCTE